MAFSWGASNTSNNNNNNTNSNTNSSSGGGGGGFGTGWGSNNNANKSNASNVNANTSSFGFGGGNGNGSEGNNANTSSFGANTTTNNNANNGSCFGANTSAVSASPWGSNANANSNSNANTQNTQNQQNASNQNPQNQNASAVNPNNDYVVPDTSTESISCLAFHPNTAHFVVGAWDNSIRYFEHRGASQSRKVAEQSHDKPVLSLCFDANSGERVFSAGCDNVIKQWSPQQNAFTALGQHSAPVRSVLYSVGGSMVLSGSWDKTVAAWDPRAKQRAFSTELGHKVFAMATHGHLLVVGCSDHDIRTIDLRQTGKVVHSVKAEEQRNKAQLSQGGKKVKEVSLKKQIRTLDMFPNGEGYVAASVGGRVIIKHLDRSLASKDFSYKCHRHNVSGGNSRNGSLNHIFAVNVVRFHRQTSVFATAGDDGECVTWDKDGRAKLFTFKEMRYGEGGGRQNENSNAQIDSSRMPIVALDYHSNGQFMLYATSYNWNKGQEFNRPQQQRPQVYLHQVSPKEMDKSKNKK